MKTPVDLSKRVTILPDAQTEALGQLVGDFLGSHWQTGIEGPVLSLWVQRGPTFPVRHFTIDPDGTVIEHGY